MLFLTLFLSLLTLVSAGDNSTPSTCGTGWLFDSNAADNLKIDQCLQVTDNISTAYLDKGCLCYFYSGCACGTGFTVTADGRTGKGNFKVDFLKSQDIRWYRCTHS